MHILSSVKQYFSLFREKSVAYTKKNFYEKPTVVSTATELIRLHAG